jgi:type II secretory pathway pseudopilin PulG
MNQSRNRKIAKGLTKMTTQQQSHHGISLLEVLAAIFVISIGLLGVLAVIPFGAFQVSKARHAEYASNMLANAAEEIFVREMGKKSWETATPQDYTKFVWCEPHPIPDPLVHISHVLVPDWQELMRGQDDLVYTTYDDKRPDFLQNGEVKIQSSGKYTWFFTYLPMEEEDSVAVDVLACYNRVPDDDVQVQPSQFVASYRGGTFTFAGMNHLTERLADTKYVFVTWGPGTQVTGGAWCRIVFLDKSNPADPKIVVTGSDLSNGDLHVYIPSGVLYHKRLEEEKVPIR